MPGIDASNFSEGLRSLLKVFNGKVDISELEKCAKSGVIDPKLKAEADRKLREIMASDEQWGVFDTFEANRTEINVNNLGQKRAAMLKEIRSRFSQEDKEEFLRNKEVINKYMQTEENFDEMMEAYSNIGKLQYKYASEAEKSELSVINKELLEEIDICVKFAGEYSSTHENGPFKILGFDWYL